MSQYKGYVFAYYALHKVGILYSPSFHQTLFICNERFFLNKNECQIKCGEVVSFTLVNGEPQRITLMGKQVQINFTAAINFNESNTMQLLKNVKHKDDDNKSNSNQKRAMSQDEIDYSTSHYLNPTGVISAADFVFGAVFQFNYKKQVKNVIVVAPNKLGGVIVVHDLLAPLNNKGKYVKYQIRDGVLKNYNLFLGKGQLHSKEYRECSGAIAFLSQREFFGLQQQIKTHSEYFERRQSCNNNNGFGGFLSQLKCIYPHIKFNNEFLQGIFSKYNGNVVQIMNDKVFLQIASSK